MFPHTELNIKVHVNWCA